MTSVRRSARDRRQNHTIYDDATEGRRARESLSSVESSSENKKKKKRDEDEEMEDASISQEEEDEVMVEASDSSSEESEAEEAPPAKARKRKAPADSKAKKQPQPRQITLRLEAPSAPKSKTRVTAETSSGHAPTRAVVQKALTALAKKALDPSETPETSLVAALLQSYKSSGNGDKKKARRSHNESLYTPQLEQICRRLLTQLADDPNKVHVNLFNLLFRSVGGSVDTNLDPDEVECETISDDEWQEIMNRIVTQMQETSGDRILLCADPLGAVQHAKTKSVGVCEFRKIYEEFWTVLGKVALSENVSTSAGMESTNNKNKTDDESESESEEEDDDDQDKASVNNKSNRFQVEVVRDLVARLIEMVAVGQPDIRAAATIAVYRLGVSMLERTVELTEKLRTAERQLAVAKRNKSSRKELALQENVDSWKRTIADLEVIVKETVLGVFMKRYKDTNKHIRADSLKILGQFTLIRPDMFLVASYLKYLGWMLSDKEACVREYAILGLLAPFQQASKTKDKSASSRIDTSSMRSVIEKFLPRLADCVLDVDLGVQERAMELVLVLLQEDFLESLDDDELWEQINLRALDPNTTPNVRRDALYFVMDQLEAFDSGPAKSETKTVECIDSIAQWVAHIIADSIDMPLEDMKVELADLVVASLRMMPEHKSLVTNWSAMLRALGAVSTQMGKSSSRSSEKKDRRMDAATQRILLRMLVCAAEQEVNALMSDDELSTVVDLDLLAARKADQATVIEAPKKKRKTESTHEDLTAALLKALPGLLESYKSETTVLQSLTSLPRYFLPSVFNLPNRKKDFGKLLSKLSELFLESTDVVVLQNCVLALTVLAKGDHSRSGEALLQLKKIASTLYSRLLELRAEKAKLCSPNDDDKESELPSAVDTQNAICLCLRRLGMLSKRWFINDLLGEDASNGDNDDVLEKFCTVVVESAAKELNDRKIVVPAGSDEAKNEELEVPEIWKTGDARLHALVADTVFEALTLLFTTTEWRLRSTLTQMDTSENVDNVGDENSKDHIVVRMRNQLVKLIALCYEQFIDDKEALNSISPEHVEFSNKVQTYAGRVAGDLRALFPKEWQNAESPLLSSFALTDDGHIIGGFVRFIRLQEDKLRADDPNVSRELLMPLARGLTANWKLGNRREAGAGLVNITGSGHEAEQIMSSMSKVLKRIEPVRLLEAHMAALRQEYENWAESEPEELESDRPTEEDISDYEAAEKAHKAKFGLIEHQATRLSNSLGVGKLKEPRLGAALHGFVHEGIRFAFSTDDPGFEEELPLGSRLTFLTILSKYLTWIRRDKRHLEQIRQYLNQEEAALRKHQDFSDIFPDDLAALTNFRRAAGLDEFVEMDDDPIEDSSVNTDDGETTGASAASFRRRMSRASSISSIRSKMSSTHGSLSPLPEEDDTVGDSEDSGKDGTPSPLKHSNITSVGTSMSLSTAGATQPPIEEASGEGSSADGSE